MKRHTQNNEHGWPLSIEEKTWKLVKTIIEEPPAREIKLKYLFSIVDAIKDDKTLMYPILKRVFGHYIGGDGKDISRIQAWMETEFLKDLTKTPTIVALGRTLFLTPMLFSWMNRSGLYMLLGDDA